MGITLPDLIVECTIRDGLDFLAATPSRVDDIFAPLTALYAQRKYGQAEVNKIKTMLQTKNIAVVHSFHEADAKSPCFSIQLGAESEAKERAHVEDFEEVVEVPLENPNDAIRVPNFVPTAYDPLSGKLSVPDGVDVTQVHPAYLFIDASQNEFELQKGRSNIPGNKFFFLAKNQTPNISGNCVVKTFLTYTQHDEKGDTSSVSLLIGIHTKDALLTKYLYAILKYIMKSRKNDLIRRGLINSSFQGSDFTRDLAYGGDQVFTRFFTLTGQVDDTWRTEDTRQADNVTINATPVE